MKEHVVDEDIVQHTTLAFNEHNRDQEEQGKVKEDQSMDETHGGNKFVLNLFLI